MALQRIVYQSSRESMRVRNFFHGVAFQLEAVLLSGYRKDERTIALIKRLKRERDMAVTAGEAYTVYSLAQTQRQVKGDMAEVGVYKGGTAKLICEAKGDIPLHLFDTFEGLPEPREADEGFFQPGWYTGKLEEVRAFLQGYENVYFYPGLFPGTAAAVAEREFSFVHLDVDLHQSTVDCLEFFYPRLVPGGVILAHDYQMPGAKKALRDYVGHQPSVRMIELANSQCMVIKI